MFCNIKSFNATPTKNKRNDGKEDHRGHLKEAFGGF
jgi:hypothetical protein